MENTFSFSDWWMGRQRFSNIYNVNAPPELVWKVLTDFESYPEIFPEIQSIQPLTDLDPIRVGSKFSQEVAFVGKRYKVFSTITDLDTDPKSRSISIAATHGDDFKDLASTETHIIQPDRESEGDRTTWIFITVQQAGGVWDRLKFSFLSCCCYGRLKETYERVVRTIEKVAISRLKEKSNISSAKPIVVQNTEKGEFRRLDREKNRKNVEGASGEMVNKDPYNDRLAAANNNSMARTTEVFQRKSHPSSTPSTIRNLTEVLKARKTLAKEGLPREEIDHMLPIFGSQPSPENHHVEILQGGCYADHEMPTTKLEEHETEGGSIIVNLTSLLQKRKKLAEHGMPQEEIDVVLPIITNA
eukprot:CAMPEP_0178910290 /NCGR_PEP_ID=MMETSP0786-20121207/9015_1 /TAXON_ID=186022 /ORGANISM="Thalassionema frauenfeldii, Strain CCMP 1798" /LENGTH=357 /DNA_ID=CAMNT_0020582525 /DNA_START=93 /DNA_END=1166 /DNA_ORIENTATION=+